jgi:tetratricopeptide (TPR) repeat protein
VLGEEDTRRLSEGAGLNTDDRLPLEFSAPRALYLDTTIRNWHFVRSFKTREFPEVTAESRAALERPDTRYWIGAGCLSRQALEDALPHFERALQLDPGHTRSLLGASWVHLNLRHPSEALDLAQQAIAREPLNANALFLAGLASQALNSIMQATAFFERAVTLQPENAEFRRALAQAGGASQLTSDQPTWPGPAAPWLLPPSSPK